MWTTAETERGLTSHFPASEPSQLARTADKSTGKHLSLPRYYPTHSTMKWPFSMQPSLNSCPEDRGHREQR